MNAVLTREVVQQVTKKLELMGKKPTHAAILAAIGGGSPSTLVKIMREIRGESAVEKDNQEALRGFREFWPIALDSAKRQNQVEIEGLQAAIDFLSAEVQRLEGGSAAAADALAKVELQRDSAFTELTRATGQLAMMRDSAEVCATKLTEATEKAEEIRGTLGREIDELRRALSAKETELARATEKIASARATADQYSNRLAEAANQFDSLRAMTAVETAAAGVRIAQGQQRIHSLETELARVQGKLEGRQETSKKSAPKAVGQRS